MREYCGKFPCLSRKCDELNTEFSLKELLALACLSPISTVVKPEYSVFAHHPHPIQEGSAAMLSAEFLVDVMHGLWKDIGLTCAEVSSSMRSLGS